MRDEIFKNRKTFAFDTEISAVFDDMASRSIPHYHENHRMFLELIAKLADNNEFTLLDLGCSVGEFLIKVQARFSDQVNLIGIDAALEMLEIARQKLPKKTKLIHSKLEELSKLPKADFIICYYTLQFIDYKDRVILLRQIYEALNENGILLLGEKTRSLDFEVNQIIIKDYHLFKKNNGYSEIEIQNKDLALDGFLRPLSFEENLKQLKSTGFNKIDLLDFNKGFLNLVARKSYKV